MWELVVGYWRVAVGQEWGVLGFGERRAAYLG